jgi:hypothetical protein
MGRDLIVHPVNQDKVPAGDAFKWQEILRDWAYLKNAEISLKNAEITPHLNKLKEKYGKNIFWPVFEDRMRKVDGSWKNNPALMKKIGSTIGSKSDWDSLLKVADLCVPNEIASADLYFASFDLFYAAGAAGATDPSLRKLIQAEFKDQKDSSYHSLLLAAFAGAAAVTKDYADFEIFWSSYERSVETSNVLSLFPLIQIDDPKAFAVVEKGLKNRTVHNLYKKLLEDVVAAGPNSHAKKLLSSLKKAP